MMNRIARWACGSDDGLAVHAVNCKRGNKRIASLSSGFLVSGFVVDEATSPEFVVDEATSPEFVVDEATSPEFVVDEATSP
ncbi:MAG: hypothetical protein ACK5T6_17575, partial [Pirellula sp.]